MQKLYQLVKQIKKIAEPIILLGDFNGHHRAWGSRTPNARGSAIINAASQCNLSILNDGSPTFIRGQIQTAIDVSFASTAVISRLRWSAYDDPQGSDHVPITLALDNVAPPEVSRRPRWLYKQANWVEYQAALDNELEQSPPASVTELTETINRVAAATIPKTSSSPGRRALYWWSDETKAAVKSRRKALRAIKRISLHYQMTTPKEIRTGSISNHSEQLQTENTRSKREIME